MKAFLQVILNIIHKLLLLHLTALLCYRLRRSLPAPARAPELTLEYMCAINIAVILVSYSSFPFPHLWTGTRNS